MIKRVAFIAFLIMYCLSFPVYADDAPKKRTIKVAGEGQVRVTPDEIVITLGVDSIDKKLSEAKQQNDKSVKSVLKTIRSFGVKEKQIRTHFVNIWPKYSHNNRTNKPAFEGYLVKNRISFTLKDISKYERLLSSILQNGANRVYGINFHTSELRKHRDRARSMAVKHALDKATKMAGELGQKVGKPLLILEQSTPSYSSYSRPQMVAAQSTARVEPLGGGYVSHDGLALGQIAINAGVNITFELE